MSNHLSTYLFALAQGILASLIWSSSFILIKVGLDYAEPLALAGLRYFLAFVLLVPLLPGRMAGPGSRPSTRTWLILLGMGLLAYPVSNGLFYWGLVRLSPTTAAFLYNFTPLFVLLMGMIGLREFPSLPQWGGFLIVIVGSYLFFSAPLGADSLVGIVTVFVSALAYALYSVLCRHFARAQRVSTLALTALPLGFGGGALLVTALGLEGTPSPSWQLAAIVVWLAAINSAIANLLWNRALIRLKAYELNVLFSVMPIETALLDWLIRGQPMQGHQIIGMVVAIAGVLLVQLSERLLRRRDPEKARIVAES